MVSLTLPILSSFSVTLAPFSDMFATQPYCASTKAAGHEQMTYIAELPMTLIDKFIDLELMLRSAGYPKFYISPTI